MALRATIDPRHLRLIASIARAGSITAAAETLGLSQPALSEQLRIFEEGAGTAVFVRHARGVRPTALGERLLATAARLEDVLGEAEDVLSADEPRGELVVGASSTPAHAVADLVASFLRRHRLARIRIVQGNSRQIAEHVATGEIPLGFVAGLTRAPRVRLERFADDVILPTCAPDAPWARETRSSNALAHVPILWREPGSGSRSMVERHLAKLGRRMQASDPVVEGVIAQRAAARAGLGIAFLSEVFVADDLRSGALSVVPFPEARVRRRMSVCFSTRELRGAAGAFLRFVRKERLPRYRPL